MKIRTDFVTNSSSSSFVVEFTATSVTGEAISYNPPDECHSDTNLSCTANGLLAATSIDQLCELLSNSLYDGEGKNDGDRLKTSSFANRLKERIKTLENLDKLTLTRKLSAWGESANRYFDLEWESSLVDTEFWALIEDACSEDEPEKQTVALKRLKDGEYKSFCIDGHTSHEFPENFLKANPKLYIDLSGLSDDLAEAVDMVYSGEVFSEVESGEETVTIDYRNKKISSEAVYHLKPSSFYD